MSANNKTNMPEFIIVEPNRKNRVAFYVQALAPTVRDAKKQIERPGKFYVYQLVEGFALELKEVKE